MDSSTKESVEPSFAYETSSAAAQREDAYRSEFEELLLSDAVSSMRKRGSTTLDETDYDRAYRGLLEARKKDWTREIGAEIGVFVGGAILSVGLTLILQADEELSTLTGGIMIFAALVIVVLSALFRHWR